MNCKYCDRLLVNRGTLAIHEKSCQSNPNRVQRKRSPLAGTKKGTVPWNKGVAIGRSAKWEEKYSLDKVLVENSTYARHLVKKRVLAERLIEYRCACCGIGPEWMGNPMPLILDHINGVSNDNRIENLRIVCSNCDSQLDTYKSRNRIRKNGRARLNAPALKADERESVP